MRLTSAALCSRQLWFLLLFCSIAVLSSVLLGAGSFSFSAIFFGQLSKQDALILYELRIPRAVLGFSVGALLAVCGAVFQSLFRNPLASPFTLGVSSAAACGAALAMQGLAFLGEITVRISAMLAALLGTIVILLGAKRLANSSSVLLLGVVLSFFFSSVLLFVQFISDANQVFMLSRWMMGELAVVGLTAPLVLLTTAVLLVVVALFHASELDLIALDDDFASARGVNVPRVTYRLFGLFSLGIGIAVSFTGPIGFVGIIVPHICRRLVSERHELLLPACFLLGGGFLCLCDLLARTLAQPFEIPVGVVTALLGGPFFAWVLLGRSVQRIG
jgi:iron complex transport system permease protein